MTTYLGKSCSFCLPRVPFVNCLQFMYLVISLFGFEGRIWDLIVSVPDHCLSFYFTGSQPRPQLLSWLKTYRCSVRVKVFELINGSPRETNKSQINTMMKQKWWLDRNVLRPTPGDSRGTEQHHWNTGAKENQQLNPGGPSNRHKSSGPN